MLRWVLLSALALAPLGCGGGEEPVRCADDDVAAEICLSCGAAGACAERQTLCVSPCTDDVECTGQYPVCDVAQGHCSTAACI